MRTALSEQLTARYWHPNQLSIVLPRHLSLVDNVFDAVALSDIARELDKAEQSHLADVRQVMLATQHTVCQYVAFSQPS